MDTCNLHGNSSCGVLQYLVYGKLMCEIKWRGKGLTYVVHASHGKKIVNLYDFISISTIF